MNIPLETYRSLLNDEALNVVNYMTEEYGIPPLFVCLHLGGFLFANVLAAYTRQGIDPPPEFVAFMDTTYPTLLKQQQDAIEAQYLTLNTKGTA